MQFSPDIQAEKDPVGQKLGPQYCGFVSLSKKDGTTIKTLEVFHKACFNLRIMTSDSVPLYYVNNSQFTPGTPDVTLHVGSDKSGQVVGACKFSHMWSNSVRVGLGDPNNIEGNDMTWEEMVCTSSCLKQSEFKFTMTLPNSGERRTFVWKRTHNLGPEASKWSLQNFKLLDENTEEILATFASSGCMNWGIKGKKGKFSLVVGDWGQDWETMVLLTCLALIEKQRRKDRASRHGAG